MRGLEIDLSYSPPLLKKIYMCVYSTPMRKRNKKKEVKITMAQIQASLKLMHDDEWCLTITYCKVELSKFSNYGS